MVVSNFYLFWCAIFPVKADAPLFVDSDGILSFAVAFENFKPIAWWNAKLVKFSHGVKLGEFTKSDATDIGGNGSTPSGIEEALSFLVGKISHHDNGQVNNNAWRSYVKVPLFEVL